MTFDPCIQSLVDRGALFVVNHSGGKDSQAMLLHVRRHVPASQILVIHAHLPEVEWAGTIEHIKATIDDLPFIVAQARKTFFEMVDHRRMWPSPATRQCTSDLKRGPIEREIRRYLADHPEFGGLVVNCMGLRAAESVGRAKKDAFKLNKRNSVAGREWYDWLPIHALHTLQVFAAIAVAGQRPHWAYQEGMTRLSCVFCIMASESDLKTAAKLNPELARRYAAKERELNHTMSMPANGQRRFLDEIVGDELRAAA